MNTISSPRRAHYPAAGPNHWGDFLPAAGMSSHATSASRVTPLARRASAVLPRAALGFFLMVSLVACGSMPPDRVVYNTLDGAVAGVQTAMKDFNVLYQAGKASEDDRTKILAAYVKFQDAVRVATKIAAGATAPDANLLQVALNNAADLVGLIRSLTGGH